jgi:hypothetical protein
MRKKRRPHYKKGERNVLCPHYGDCLDEVVKKAWDYWNCGECPQRFHETPRADILTSVNDAIPYFTISSEVSGKVW